MVDHEAVNIAEAIDRARAGMKVLMRFGSGVPDLPNLIGAYSEAGISARQLAVCTDVLLPETLAEGGLDVAVRRIIAAGVRPAEAIAMATINVAESFRADFDMGSISPGRFADMILIEDLAALSIRKVIFGGKLVAEDGAMRIDFSRPTYPDFMLKTVRPPATPTAADFMVKTARPDGPVKVRCVGVSDTLLATDERQIVLEAKDGVIAPDPAHNVAMIAMVDRLNKNSGVATAFVHGFGLKAGAMASTHNAVCENLAIVGMNGADMAFAEEKLREMGGGQVIVRNGEVIAAFPMPMLGLFSDRPFSEVLAKRKEIAEAARAIGCNINDPLLKLEFAFAAAGIPHLRMSEEGLLRTSPRERVALEVDA